MNKLVIGFASALAIMAAGSAVAQTAAVAVDSRPGAVTEARTVKTEGTITAIDAETRMVTLQGAGGNTLEVAAGPEVKNFAQLKVGDIIELEMLEALTVELRKGGKAVVERTVREDAVAAEPGQKPAGAIGHQVHAVADVTAINAETQTVTLKGARGVVDLKVKDPEQFKLIAVGDQLEATYTQAVAVVVRPKDAAE